MMLLCKIVSDLLRADRGEGPLAWIGFECGRAECGTRRLVRS